MLNTRVFLCYYRRALVFFNACVILTQGIPVPVHAMKLIVMLIRFEPVAENNGQ